MQNMEDNWRLPRSSKTSVEDDWRLTGVIYYVLVSHKSKFSTDEFSGMSEAAMLRTSLKYAKLWIRLYITVTNKMKINVITSY
jgi:hypothetical protein